MTSLPPSRLKGYEDGKLGFRWIKQNSITCRVTFPTGFQRELFSTILQNQKITLKELARVLNVSRWTLKRWRLGAHSIPGSVFARLYLMYHEVRDIAQRCNPEIRNANWGAKQGGLATSRKLSHEETREKMARVRSFIKEDNRWQVPTPLQLTPEVCEFFGIVLGDGCLSKFYAKKEKRVRYCVIITNNKHERDYLENHVSSLIGVLFKRKPRVRYDKYNDVIRIIISSRRIFEQSSLLGLPVGKGLSKKSRQQIKFLDCFARGRARRYVGCGL